MTTEKTLSRDPSDMVKDNDGQSDQLQDVYVQDASNDIYEEGSVDPVYQAKARLLNAAIQEIGMGRYQDVVAPGTKKQHAQLIGGLILSPVVSEFQFQSPFLSLALNIGLFVGAVFWGLGCDIWGRRWSFNITLLIAGIFGLAAGGSNSFLTLASLLAVLGVGVGGNLPVDSAVFLDFVPGSHQYLLTVLSIWWSLGQLFVNLVAWPLIANFSCPQNAVPGTCTRSENMGWRYLLFTLGGCTLVLWGLRFFIFTLEESPRFLAGRGHDEEAVAVIQRLATYNGRPCSLTVEQLTKAGEVARQRHGPSNGLQQTPKVFSRSSDYTIDHVKALFETRKLAWSTSLLISLWASRGAKFGDSTYYITYRNQDGPSSSGCSADGGAPWQFPRASDQSFLHEMTLFNDPPRNEGLTGVFLFASTTARNSDALLGWNCGYSFFSNIMYGVLYAISPELFPAKDRGTGNGLTATATRMFGILTAVPVWVSGALIMGAGALALLLPYEPRGKASL
ncbi:hypothetical protein EIP86_009449 [Pleurotus ostreatoroseus]|nr:hypothetical protein EIP86_009449 [Pleurotus ostreatoroseus]